jgi:hypothetical protein
MKVLIGAVENYEDCFHLQPYRMSTTYTANAQYKLHCTTILRNAELTAGPPVAVGEVDDMVGRATVTVADPEAGRDVVISP